ncbi:hypothetical protein FL966_09930 [Caproiciproducens galactitolivorans]|uniref:Peptidylprolyl isomerase n=1 Tax=Caproiciproducens galactitolivorans TaxID=642589 RepID=A0A4Z0Y2D3_9FIRM|nr:hypothetical protein [Caproiciproducens galactitolivorans]QEY35338.1 hypothetical protein FL966_09930 [Caproiciproducens galactitolivorans]TGJ77037.1 hypothetical protein CAGA_11120 [Caproiciproducens galactitolivorans]
MIKILKKGVAVLLAFIMAASTAACASTDKSWAMKNNSLTVPIGVYIYNLYSAYQSANTLKKDPTKPVLDQKIENKSAEEYIKDKALTYTKMLLVLNDKMKELNLSLTAEETKTISSVTDAQWEQASSTLEKYGVSKQSFNLAYADFYTKYQKVFTALYGKGGKKEVPDSELKSYFEKNYTDFSFIAKSLYNTKSDGSVTPFTDQEKAAVKKQFDAYAAEVSSKKKTMKQIADEYKAASKQTTEQLQEATENLNTSTSYPADLKTLLDSMKPGEVKSAEISGAFLVVMKNDITKKTKDELSMESSRNNLLAEMKAEEFSKDLDKAAQSYSNVTLNQAAIDSYKPSMFVTETSSAAPAASTASAASSAAGTASTASK